MGKHWRVGQCYRLSVVLVMLLLLLLLVIGSQAVRCLIKKHIRLAQASSGKGLSSMLSLLPHYNLNLTLRWKVIFSYISPETDVPNCDELVDDTCSPSEPLPLGMMLAIFLVVELA